MLESCNFIDKIIQQSWFLVDNQLLNFYYVIDSGLVTRICSGRIQKFYNLYVCEDYYFTQNDKTTKNYQPTLSSILVPFSIFTRSILFLYFEVVKGSYIDELDFFNKNKNHAEQQQR